VGKIDEGFYNLLTTLNVERLGAGALALGVGQATFEASLQYAKQRNAFERPIGQYQHIQRYISDMAVNLEQARLLLYKAAWLDSQGKPAVLECNMAKLACTEAAAQTTSDAMRIFASVGYSTESDVQRYFRDSRVGLFAPVSNEMIRNLICQQLGLPRSY
jgi:acyl-CoA dehydrogenase